MKRHPRSDTQSAEAARVGEELRDARLALGVSLEEMADELRINRRYLAALEEGRVRDLPGIAYATGFVRSYSQILGLDAPEMVRRFREGAGVAAPAKDLVFPEPVPDRGVPAGAVIMLGAVLAVVGYAGWYYWTGSSTRTAEEVPALPPRLEQSARGGRSAALAGRGASCLHPRAAPRRCAADGPDGAECRPPGSADAGAGRHACTRPARDGRGRYHPGGGPGRRCRATCSRSAGARRSGTATLGAGAAAGGHHQPHRAAGQ
jgi:cytoskeleton protein RodZ